ncbi:hypothetical protein, partial [Fibrobacter sp. UWB3]|uniref:hypothetical protein n=1 Tax=Fibrobacter sp. UWB3 TaxID=1964357 RepID=UPI000B678F1C
NCEKNSLFFTFFDKNGMYAAGTTHYPHSVNRNLFWGKGDARLLRLRSAQAPAGMTGRDGERGPP